MLCILGVHVDAMAMLRRCLSDYLTRSTLDSMLMSFLQDVSLCADSYETHQIFKRILLVYSASFL